MTEAKSSRADWIGSWIEQQRDLLKQFAVAGGAVDAAGRMHELNERWLNVLKAWQSTPANGASADEGAAPDLAKLLLGLPALGLAREQTQVWRDLTALQGECQELHQEWRSVLTQVQADALSMLEQRVREREAAGTPIATHRELYDLWIECGEQVYSTVAHSEPFCKLQAKFGNAVMRLRASQQALLEQALKAFDLPTRSELNTVHRQMRELRARVATLEAQLAESGRSARK